MMNLSLTQQLFYAGLLGASIALFFVGIGGSIALGVCCIKVKKKKVIKGFWSEKAQNFLKELQAEDPDDYHILDMRLGALVEELGEEAYRLSLAELDLTVCFLRLQLDKAEQAEDKASKEVG